MRMEWVMAVQRECQGAGIPFFYKQDAGSRTELRSPFPHEAYRGMPVVP